MVAWVVWVWAIANFLHPLVLGIWWNEVGSLDKIILASFYSLALSIPSLLTSVVVIQLLKMMNSGSVVFYILWLLAIPIVVFLNIQCLLLLFGGRPNLDPSILEFGIAPSIAAFVSSLACGSYFFKRMKEIAAQSENEREVL